MTCNKHYSTSFHDLNEGTDKPWVRVGVGQDDRRHHPHAPCNILALLSNDQCQLTHNDPLCGLLLDAPRELQKGGAHSLGKHKEIMNK